MTWSSDRLIGWFVGFCAIDWDLVNWSIDWLICRVLFDWLRLGQLIDWLVDLSGFVWLFDWTIEWNGLVYFLVLVFASFVLLQEKISYRTSSTFFWNMANEGYKGYNSNPRQKQNSIFFSRQFYHGKSFENIFMMFFSCPEKWKNPKKSLIGIWTYTNRLHLSALPPAWNWLIKQSIEMLYCWTNTINSDFCVFLKIFIKSFFRGFFFSLIPTINAHSNIKHQVICRTGNGGVLKPKLKHRETKHPPPPHIIVVFCRLFFAPPSPRPIKSAIRDSSFHTVCATAQQRGVKWDQRKTPLHFYWYRSYIKIT